MPVLAAISSFELQVDLREGRRGTRLLAEILVDQRAKQVLLTRLMPRNPLASPSIRFALEFEQPGELLRGLVRKWRVERSERLIGEQLDQFRHQQARALGRRRRSSGRQPRYEPGCRRAKFTAAGPPASWPTGTALSSFSAAIDRLYVRRVAARSRTGRLPVCRTNPTREVDCDRPSPGGHQVRDQIVVDVRVVGEAVQQQERRPAPGEVGTWTFPRSGGFGAR